eukprot:765300-Hanusia_phi.AAC.1
MFDAAGAGDGVLSPDELFEGLKHRMSQDELAELFDRIVSFPAHRMRAAVSGRDTDTVTPDSGIGLGDSDSRSPGRASQSGHGVTSRTRI